MTGKTAYAIVISFMAFFATLAANAAEVAAQQRSAVLAKVGGNSAAYIAALEAYDRALTKAFTSKTKPKSKRILAVAHPIASTGKNDQVVAAQPTVTVPSEIDRSPANTSSESMASDNVATTATSTASSPAM
jgi:hypothetical protein